MRKGPFISTVAAFCRIEEKTVRIFARELINAGLLSSGGRGVNAPHMTHEDLATMLIAMLGTDKPARAVETVEHFGQMQLSAPDGWASGGRLPESPDHTFRDLMDCFCDPATELPLGITIEVQGSAYACVTNDDVELEDGRSLVFMYVPRKMVDRALEGDFDDALSLHGLTRGGRISAMTIEEIKSVIFSDQSNDVDTAEMASEVRE